MIADAPKRSVR